MAAPACPAFAQQAESEPFLRVTEANEGLNVTLEVAIRRFVPEDKSRPVVYLASAVHIADRSFYKELQRFLDARDLVLFEAVKPAGAGDYSDPTLTDEQRHGMAQRQVLFLAGAAEMFREEHGTYPRDTDDFLANLPPDMSSLVRGALTDPWGRPLIFRGEGGACAQPESYDIISLGSDGAEGGEGSEADITRSRFRDGRITIPTSEDGIQAKLADALGLTFQLNEMSHEGENWRNSDLSMDQIMDRMGGSGESADALFESLKGEGISIKLAGVLLKLIKLSPSMQAMIKVMLVEILGSADGFLSAVPPEMQGLLDVLIHDRNDAVQRDIDSAIHNEPDLREIAIIYGAGHLPDLQSRLEGKMGYKSAGDTWLRAIELDLSETGMTAKQAQQLRTMLRKSLEQQLKAMQKTGGR